MHTSIQSYANRSYFRCHAHIAGNTLKHIHPQTGPLLQVEAVENHMPEVIMVDEIGTEAEALACRTIAERGVQLVATAHGQLLENLIKNPTLADLVGGIQSVTLGACCCLTAESRHQATCHICCIEQLIVSHACMHS